MDDKTLVMSKQGLQELKDELEVRINKTRKEIADEIDKARQQGDLSENSAYKSALESNEFNETRINQVQELITNAVVEENVNPSIISIGSTVTIINETTGAELTYQIVGEREADPSASKISIASPIGAALKGKKKGHNATVTLPHGEVVFSILKVK